MVDLYTATILDSGKPVHEAKQAKRPRGKKEKDVEAVEPVKVEEEVVASEPEPVAAKKPRSEKQIAAAKRLVETRKAKREAVEQAKLAEENAKREAEEAVVAAEALKAQKKLEQKEKRRLKREEGKPQLIEMTASESSEPVEPAPKRARKAPKSNDEPPAWLEKLIAGIKTEEARQSHEKKPVKQIRIEAEAHAQKAWNEPVTRARVQQHQDESLTKMYSMMFSNRNF